MVSTGSLAHALSTMLPLCPYRSQSRAQVSSPQTWGGHISHHPWGSSCVSSKDATFLGGRGCRFQALGDLSESGLGPGGGRSLWVERSHLSGHHTRRPQHDGRAPCSENLRRGYGDPHTHPETWLLSFCLTHDSPCSLPSGELSIQSDTLAKLKLSSLLIIPACEVRLLIFHALLCIRGRLAKTSQNTKSLGEVLQNEAHQPAAGVLGEAPRGARTLNWGAICTPK